MDYGTITGVYLPESVKFSNYSRNCGVEKSNKLAK